jgi:aminoglycoside N3'-acetyltransferase
MVFKKVLRASIRKVIKAKEHETISDAIDRRKYKFYGKVNKKSYNLDELKEILVNMGIKKGDIVMVHVSWRAFIGFSIKPQQLIDMLLDLIGEKGTLLMPTYGNNKEKFDVNNTPSAAGVVTEYFRKTNGVKRSCNSYFSISAIGPMADELLSDHINSEFGFDKFSPYYKLTQCEGKILLLGLGKSPHKISAFHCATYILSRKLPYYKNVLSYRRKSILIDQNGNKFEKTILDRMPSCQNKKKKMRHVFKGIPSESRVQERLGYLDICLLDANKTVETAIRYGENGYPIYNLKAKKELFVPLDITNFNE